MTPTPSRGVTSRLGVYLTADEFADAKAAYLADWTNGGQADTFGRWCAEAIAHATGGGQDPQRWHTAHAPPARLPNRLIR